MGLQGAEQGALDHAATVRAAKRQLEQPFRMGHEADDAARLVANAGDVALGAVGVGLGRCLARLVAIAKHDAPFAFEAIERFFIGEVVAFRVRDRQAHHLIIAVALGEERLVVVDAQRHVAADELQRSVAHQHAG